MAKLNIQDIVSALKDFSLVELTELVKAIESEFGVSATVSVAAGGASQEESSSAPTELSVILKDGGSQKINVIKIVREVTGLGLMDAKKAVDGAPSTIKEGLPVAQAQELAKRLTDAGATVELK